MQVRQKLIISVTLVIAVVGCSVKTPLVERVEYKDGGYSEWTGGGLIYALPKTNFDATFEISKSAFKKPNCTGITQVKLKRLGLKKEQLSDKKRTVYAIHGSELSSSAVPDENKLFGVHLPESDMFADSSLLINIGTTGVIESLDVSATSKSIELANKVLELTLTMGSALVPYGSKHPSESETGVDCDGLITNYEEFQNQHDGYRDGPSPMPKDTVDKYQAEIKEKQAAILAHFVGEASIMKGQLFCSLSPASEDDIQLFALDAKKGFDAHSSCIFSNTSLKGNYSFKEGDKVTEVLLEVEKPKVSSPLVQAYMSSTTKTTAGFFFNVPENVYVRIIGHKKIETNKKIFTMPQLGLVQAIPRVKGNSPALIVNLHPDSGALKSVKVAHTAANVASMISTASSGASGYLTALKAQKDREELASDELTSLTREKSLLEAKVAIETAKDALDQWVDSGN